MSNNILLGNVAVKSPASFKGALAIFVQSTYAYSLHSYEINYVQQHNYTKMQERKKRHEKTQQRSFFFFFFVLTNSLTLLRMLKTNMYGSLALLVRYAQFDGTQQ